MPSDRPLVYPPPPAFAAQADVGAEAHAWAEADPFGFWAEQAGRLQWDTPAGRLQWAEQAGRLQWDTPWDTVFDDAQWPTARWFGGGRLDVAVNCVDRHVTAGRGDKVAGTVALPGLSVAVVDDAGVPTGPGVEATW